MNYTTIIETKKEKFKIKSKKTPCLCCQGVFFDRVGVIFGGCRFLSRGRFFGGFAP